MARLFNRGLRGAVQDMTLIEPGASTYNPNTGRVVKTDPERTAFRGIVRDVSREDYNEGINLSGDERQILALAADISPAVDDQVEADGVTYYIRHIKTDPLRAVNTLLVHRDRRET